MRLHKEGRVSIPLTLLLLASLVVAMQLSLRHTAYAWVANGLSLVALVLFLLVVNFFRNPTRRTPMSPHHVISPCDGKVVAVEEVEAVEYFGDRRIQLSVFMSPLDVHANRMPLAGEIVYHRYAKGKHLVAWHPKSSEENEQNVLVVRGEQTEVGFKQIAGAMARRIKWYVRLGDQLEQGAPFGFITFGSRMDILLPMGSELCVTLNQHVVAGETILARLPPVR